MNLMAPLHRARAARAARFSDTTRVVMNCPPGEPGEVPPDPTPLARLMRNGRLDLTRPALLFGAAGSGKTAGVGELVDATAPEQPEVYVYDPCKNHVTSGLLRYGVESLISHCAHDRDGGIELMRGALEVVYARRARTEAAGQVGRPLVLIIKELPVLAATTDRLYVQLSDQRDSGEEDDIVTVLLWDLLYLGPQVGVRVYATAQQIRRIPQYLADRFQLVYASYPAPPVVAADYKAALMLQESR